MYFFIVPIGFILWYLAYEAKPNIDDELTHTMEEENVLKRNKLLGILNRSF